MTDSMNINDIAKPDGPDGESFEFSTVGDTVQGKVVHFDVFTRTNKYKKEEEQRILVITLEQPDGSNMKIWPVICSDINTDAKGNELGWSSRMAKAITAAIKAAGEEALKTGSTLAVKFDGEQDTEFGNPAKLFVAEYAAPVAAVVTDEHAADGAVTGLLAS